MSSVNCKEHARLTAHNNDAIKTLSKVSILGAVHASFYNVKNIPLLDLLKRGTIKIFTNYETDLLVLCTKINNE